MATDKDYTVGGDFYKKDNSRRTVRIVLVVLFALILLASLTLYLEMNGTDAMEGLDRIVVNNYLRRNYGTELGEFTTEYTGYNAARKQYEYRCTSGAGEFTMGARMFKIKYDGYFAAFLTDRAAGDALSAEICGYMEEHFAPEGGQTLTLKVSSRVPAADSVSSSDVQELLKNYGSTLEFEAVLSGGKLTFEEYKLLAYDLLNTLRGTLRVPPEYMRIYYYRTADADAGETEPVLSYESVLVTYMFNFNKSGFLGASNVNYIVELGNKQVRSLKTVAVARIVSVAVIGLTVVGLGTLWIVRRVKRSRKERAADNGGAAD